MLTKFFKPVNIPTFLFITIKIFYALIYDKVNSFSWKIQDFGNKKGCVTFNSPHIKRLEPSLLSLLLNNIDDSTNSVLHQKYSCVEKLPNDLVISLNDLFKKIQLIYPDKQNMAAIVDWIARGLEGEKLTLFSLICPDYSVEPTGNPLQPFRHIFNGLGSEIGLIAKRVMEVTPAIKEMLNRFENNDFGQATLTQKKLINIIKARKPLYDKWFGCQKTFMDYIPVLLNQGAKYAAVGDIIKKTYPNCLILGADHSTLSLFYSINQFIPSLYLKRFYC